MVSLSPSSTSSESFSIRMLGCRVVFSRLAPFLATSTLTRSLCTSLHTNLNTETGAPSSLAVPR